MNKFLKIITVSAMTALMCGLAACGCSSEETTEAGITLPMDTFDDYTGKERHEAIQKDIDEIAALQKEGVDTDEKKSAYNTAVNDLLEKAPEYKDIVEAGKDDYNIDTDKIQEKLDEEIKESESESAATDSDGNKQEIQLPTVKIK